MTTAEAPRKTDTRTQPRSGGESTRRGWTYRDSTGKTHKVDSGHKDRGGNNPHDVLSA